MDKPQDWDPHLYDDSHHYVTKYGEDVLALLDPQPGQRILDVGCGTGHLTALMAEAGAAVVGLDGAHTMVEQARASYPGLTFVQADAGDFSFEQPFDAVFSNAALHWMLPPEPVIASVFRALRPGGRFVAEMGGKGNVAALTAALKGALVALGHQPPPGTLRYFPSPAEYATLLEAAGFRVAYLTHFDRPTRLEGEVGIAKWMRMYVTGLLADVPQDEQPDFVKGVEERLRPTQYRDGAWWADYVRLRFVAERPGG